MTWEAVWKAQHALCNKKNFRKLVIEYKKELEGVRSYLLRDDFSAELQKEDRFHIYRDVITVVVKSMCKSSKDREGSWIIWKAKDESYKSKGRINPCSYPNEIIMVPGFVGQPKGIKQILWERGRWRPEMVRSKTEAEIKRIML